MGTMEARLAALEAIVRQQHSEIQHLRDRVGFLEAEAGHTPAANKRAKPTHPSTDQPDRRNLPMSRPPSASSLHNDLLIRCASYLDAEGLARLGRTGARFGIPQAGERRSLVNEAAHRRFVRSATSSEKWNLPKYGDESDVGLCRALEQLRKPLCFDELVGRGFSPQDHPASATHMGI